MPLAIKPLFLYKIYLTMKSFFISVVLSGIFFSVKSQSPITIEKLWSSDTLLKTPESVFYNKESKEIYVTNMNTIHDKVADQDGFISTLNMDGKIKNLKWVTGLDDPKGMAKFNGKLYVGDLKNLVEIDISTGKILKKHTIEGAIFLNDVAVDENGVVYVTDSFANKVFRLNMGKLELWIEGNQLNKPNGIFISNNLFLLANMNEGILYKIDSKSKDFTKCSENITAADGISCDNKGNFFVSNWNGEVYFVNKNGTNWKILDTKSTKINAADIEYIADSELLLVPTFFGNHISAYKVNSK